MSTEVKLLDLHQVVCLPPGANDKKKIIELLRTCKKRGERKIQIVVPLP